MKKTLKILLDNSDYVIELSSDKRVVISGNDLILKADDLYKNFYSDIKLGERLETIVVIDESVVGSREIHIANEIKSILEDIEKRINEKAKDSNDNDDATVNNLGD